MRRTYARHGRVRASERTRTAGARGRRRAGLSVVTALALAAAGFLAWQQLGFRGNETVPAAAVVPSAPAGLVITSVAPHSVSLAWSSRSYRRHLRDFVVLRDGARLATVPHPAFTDGALHGHTTYRYQVEAVSRDGVTSAPSPVLTITTSGRRPGRPAHLQAQALSPTHVRLSWAPVGGTASAVTYEVHRDGRTIGTTTTPSFDDTSAQPATKYWYTVRARLAAGLAGHRSKRISVTTPAASAARAGAVPAPSASPGSAVSSAPGGFPGASNTGYQNAPGYPGHLQNCGATVRSNTTYQYCDFPGGLSVGTGSAPVSNVTFIGCRFSSNSVDNANVVDYGNNITFSYDTFAPSVAPSQAEPVSASDLAVPNSNGYQYGINQGSNGALTIDHSDFWGFAEAVQFSSSNQSQPVVISNSWIHNSRNPGSSDHTDGILENYGNLSYIVVNHNTIVGDGNTNALALQGGAPYSHVSITNNYFSGYGYMVNSGSNTQSTNMVFTGNVWGTDIKPYYGPLYNDTMYTTPGLGGMWKGNTIRVAAGTNWMAAGNNGLYWWPTDGNPSSPSQIIGHKTDYPGP